MLHPAFEDIINAHKQILPYIHLTPVFTNQSINKILNADFFFKAENLQKVGAFKFRGANNALLQLNKHQLKNGVATHSSGNHAAALALAAKIHGVPAYIVMPRNAPEIKKKAVKGYGAQITFSEPTQADREATLDKIVAETGATFIHPYDNFNVIAGQGTAAKELLEKYPDLDIIMTPVGGGGLLSGTSIAAKAINKKIKVIAAEPANADDAFRSFYSNNLFPALPPNTIADGLLTSLSPLTFEIIKNNVDAIYTASEKSIIEAMRLIWERMKIIIEPSSAVPLATIMENKKDFERKKIGIILSGGNVELSQLPF